jgi:hypothetical protein
VISCLIEKLYEKNAYAIDQRNTKNSLGCLIPGSIDVIGEECNISYQAPDTKKGDQPVFPEKHSYKFRESIPGEAGQVNNNKYDHRGNKTQNESHLQVILL